MSGLGAEYCIRAVKKVVWAALVGIFSLVYPRGALVGCPVGAITGQTSETGFLRGAGIGVVSGAIVALELLDSIVEGQFLSKITLFGSSINGNFYKELVTPALLKACQWQTIMYEEKYEEIFDLYDVNGSKGLSCEVIRTLPVFYFQDQNRTDHPCTICLQGFEEGECCKRFQKCRHFFHSLCIDEWLVRDGCCPICRQEVLD
ncbi:Zinc finger, RING-type, partial [Dillenia turbinata]